MDTDTLDTPEGVTHDHGNVTAPRAFLVFNGTELIIPPPMIPEGETPESIYARGQTRGCVGDRLTELAGRICYDSLGAERSRKSADYHKHIAEVDHLSVCEHFHMLARTFVPFDDALLIMAACASRPDIQVSVETDTDAPPPIRRVGLTISFNLRTAIEWFREQTDGHPSRLPDIARASLRLGNTLQRIAAEQCLFFSAYARVPEAAQRYDANLQIPNTVGCIDPNWLTFYLSGSRGFSHEMIRHKWRTAVSQRSTRYVDEVASPYVLHPLLTQATLDFVRKGEDSGETQVALTSAALSASMKARAASRDAYRKCNAMMAEWLTSHGSDNLTARKQARGVARGFLGNALQTEMLFSASIPELLHIFDMRGGVAADAEIREVVVAMFNVAAEHRISRVTDAFEVKGLPNDLGYGLVRKAVDTVSHS